MKDSAKTTHEGTVKLRSHFIKCLHCGMKSFHPCDISERYCGHCHIFHDLQDEDVTHVLGADP